MEGKSTLPAPDFTRPDTEGNPVSLATYRGVANVIIVFLRGFA